MKTVSFSYLRGTMLTTTPALVLHATRYGDTRLIVSLFTRAYGYLSVAVANGMRRQRHSTTHYLFPLSEVDVSFEYHATADVQRARSIECRSVLHSIPYTAAKRAQALLLADVLRHALRHEATNIPLYEYLRDSLTWLDAAREGYANFHIVFLLLLTKYLGIYPNITSYRAGAYFSLDEGQYVATPPTTSSILTAEEGAALHLLCRLSYRSMHLLRMSRTDRNHCVARLLDYYARHLPSFPALRSFTILTELFV